MIPVVSYFTFIRPGNAAMAGGAVALGFWLSHADRPLWELLLLMISAVCATGFGNVINDIRDIESDKINHPDRPLPTGEISPFAAGVFALLLLITALLCAYLVSWLHLAATAVPCILLFFYARRLKATPLAGNIIVSLLVAYPIIYGGLGAEHREYLFAPAALAFLLNLIREIVKDIQDSPGDTDSGIITTASLPETVIKIILYALTLVYTVLLFIPYSFGHFQKPYLIIVLALIIPLHLYTVMHLLSSQWKQQLGKLSKLTKLELLFGLAALAVDRGIGEWMG
ncbi:MAG: hypothetical protein GF401_10020 [Chitinivibrionales bacterium]|nr:hypothetical protein [Chitinivibrionales bacterium]